MTDLLKLTSLCQNLECEYILNAPMKDYTTFQIGGPCDILVRPYDEGQTAALIQFCAANGIRWQVIGNGSNLLVPDGGVSGAVIQIGSNFSYIRKSLKEGEILCAAGASLSAAAAFAQKEGLTGLEFAWGIPGNVGGALFMNAGAYGGEMKDVVVCADYVDGMGNTRTIAASEMQLGYGLANIINILAPEVLVIGGGVSNEGENLLRPLVESVRPQLYVRVPEKQTRIVLATLGNDAGLIGAAFLNRAR